MEAMREIMFGNWGPMEPEGIFGAKIGRMAFYEAHTKDIDNLFHDSHWRAKMTPQHLEMRKHPNRSYEWIPNEILEERAELFRKWCGYILSEGEWLTTKDTWSWGNQVCLICGTDEETCNQKLKNEKDTDTTTYYARLTFGWCNFCRPMMEQKIAQSTPYIKATSSNEKV